MLAWPKQNVRKGNRRRRILTDEQVREIRKRYDAGETQRSIAKDFSVTTNTVRQIIRRESYKDVQ